MTCKTCGWWEKLCKCNGDRFSFNTSKDRLWNFVSTNIDKHPIEIHSKRQFNRLCKERGLVQVTRNDVLDKGEPMRPKGNPHKEKINRVINDTFREVKNKYAL